MIAHLDVDVGHTCKVLLFDRRYWKIIIFNYIIIFNETRFLFDFRREIESWILEGNLLNNY